MSSGDWKLIWQAIFIIYCQIFVKVSSIEENHNAETQGVVGGLVKIPCDLRFTKKTKFVNWHKDNEPIYNFDSRGVDLVKAKHYPLAKQQKMSFMPLESPSYLLMQDLKPEDQGYYKCSVSYVKYRAETYTTFLMVIVPPEPIKILDSSQTEIVNETFGPLQEDAEVEIICQVTGGRPRPVITWWKGGDLLDNEIDSRSGDILQNTLKLGPLKREDQGKTLVCQTTNSNLTAPLSEKVTLDIHYSPIRVEITTPESPLVANAEYQIECRSDGARPPAIITWSLGGKRLVNTEDYTTNSGNTTLSAAKFIPSDEDGGKSLECRSQSPTINHTPLTDYWILDIHYSPKVNLTITPTEDIKEGDDVTLTCDAIGNPKPTKISWFHKKREIDSLLLKRINSINNSLTLSSVTRNMSGMYSCIASNPVGNGNSEGVVLHIQYVPVCSTEAIKIVGASMLEEISVFCNVKASPDISSFRWQFNQSNETIDLAEDTFTAEEKQSVLTYTPRTASDFGILLCWGTNDLGEQEAPCIFQLVEAGLPAKPENCTFVGNYSSSSVFVQCVEGHDGGLPQMFIAEVMDMSRQSLTRNVSTEEPYFAIDDLPPGTDFLLTIYSVNAKGPSEKQNLQVYTAAPTERTVFLNTQIFPITPILGVLIGVVGALVIVAVIIAFVMCLRSSSSDKATPRSGAKGGRSPPNSKDGGESVGEIGNGRTEADADGDGFPTKLKHANIYETVAYETSEDGKRSEIVSEKCPDENIDKDNVEYAELNFSNCKKVKTKKPKSDKKSSKSNGKIHGSYDPTLYASIDHVQTEKQKLVTKEREQQQQNQQQPRQASPPRKSLSPGQHPQLQKSGIATSSKPKPTPPTIPSQVAVLQQDSTTHLPPSPPPPLSPTDASGGSARSKDVRRSFIEATIMASSPHDETSSKKATGKPTNLDKPSIPKKPSFAPDASKRKKTAETQTSPPDLEDGESNEEESRTKNKKRDTCLPPLNFPLAPDDSKEDIPLMDVTIESSL